jgi:hypothetical protein
LHPEMGGCSTDLQWRMRSMDVGIKERGNRRGSAKWSTSPMIWGKSETMVCG